MSKNIFALVLACSTLLLTACKEENSSNQGTTKAQPTEQKSAETQKVKEQVSDSSTQKAVEIGNNFKNVSYKCDKGTIQVKYAINENDVISAQIFDDKNAEITPVLNRKLDATEENLFIGGQNNEFSWSTEKASAQELTEKEANMLTKNGQNIVNGEKTEVSEILYKYCEIVK